MRPVALERGLVGGPLRRGDDHPEVVRANSVDDEPFGFLERVEEVEAVKEVLWLQQQRLGDDHHEVVATERRLAQLEAELAEEQRECT